MTTSSEKLIIELKADTAGLDSSLNKINKKLGEVEESADGADISLNKFASAAKATATAVTAAAAAITTMIVLAGKSQKEMDNLARTAGTTKKNFEELAFAFSQFGVDAKGTADAMNDVRERLGEFAAAGTGPFQDFADVMGLGAEEAQTLASEMQHLSGEDAIGLMVSRMEDAEVPAAQLSFVMKSMSNDLEYASKAFAENGKELDRLKGRLGKVNEQLSITAEQAELLAGASESFDLMLTAIGKATTAISAEFAPMLNDFFNDIIDVVPNATNTIIDFLNSFRSAEDIKSLRSINAQIADTEESIATLEARLDNENVIGRTRKALQDNLNGRLEDLKAYNAQKNELEENQRLFEEKQKREGGEIGGIVSTGGTGGDDKPSAELQALLDSFKTEEQLRQEKFESELKLLEEHEELKKELIKRYQDEAAEREQELIDERVAREEKATNMIVKNEQGMAKDIIGIARALAGDNEKIGKILFLADQALAVSEVMFNTQVASMRALAELGPIAGPPAAAAIEAKGYTSMALIAAQTLGGLSSGGSSGSSGSLGGSTGGNNQQPQDFVDDTELVQVAGTIVTSEGTTESSVAMPNEDDMARAMWGIIKMAQDNGSIA